MSKVNFIREKFPFLKNKVNSSYPLIYLDNAATTQKPIGVIKAISDYYSKGSANIHRGSYRLARHSEYEVEKVRSHLKDFIHARVCEEIMFTSGITESLNMIAEAYGGMHVSEGDEVLISVMEHHSNFLPWKALCDHKKAHLRVVPLTNEGKIDLAVLKKMLSPRTKIIAISYVSNVLGTINPVAQVCALAHEKGAVVVVDAAQAIAHLKVDVQALDCDFLAFSAHKMYGPTGIGVLYGKEKLLREMNPYKVGGGMIQRFSKNSDFVYEKPPYRFEAGTLHIAGIIGLGAALRFMEEVEYPFIRDHEKALTAYLCSKMDEMKEIKWLGGIRPEVGILTFTVQGMHPLDIGLRLDLAQIAIRTGNFCANPLMDYMGVDGGVRVSLGIYNTAEEIDRFYTTLLETVRR